MVLHGVCYDHDSAFCFYDATSPATASGDAGASGDGSRSKKGTSPVVAVTVEACLSVEVVVTSFEAFPGRIAS